MIKYWFILLLLLAAALALFIFRRPPDPESSTTLTTVDTPPSAEPRTSSYQLYTPSAFTANSSKRRVLFFYANWCPTCRPVDQELSANSASLPSDLVVYRVNYNDSDTSEKERELASRYSVTYQHTFVQIDELDNQVTSWNGGGLGELLTNLH